MNCLILYCHPNPKSFNHAILEVTEKALKARGFDVRVKDLYAEKYDPVMWGEDLEGVHTGKTPPAIVKAQSEITWAQRLIFIYPVWWYGAPAMLKGWFDRNFTYGFAFKSENGSLKGLLKHEKALVLHTTGVPDIEYKPRGHDRIIEQWITEGTLHFCGIKNTKIETFYDIGGIGDEGRKKILDQIEASLKSW